MQGVLKLLKRFSKQTTRGLFKLILGPMFSGKTKSLFAEIERYEYAGEKYVLVMSFKNEREDDMTTHDGEIRSSVSVWRLSELKNVFDLRGIRAILIDEVFMFDDVEDTVNTIRGWLDDGIDVIVASLDIMAKGSVPRAIVGIMTLKPDVIEHKLAACVVKRSPKCNVKYGEYTMIYDPDGNLIPREELDEVMSQQPEDSEKPKLGYKAACESCYYNRAA